MTKVVKTGDEIDRMVALLDALYDDADWMGVHLDQIDEKICEQSGVFEVPRISSQGRVLMCQAFLRGYLVAVFF